MKRFFAESVRVRAKNGADVDHKKLTKQRDAGWNGFLKKIRSDRALMVKNSDHEISRKIYIGILEHVANFINSSE